MMKSSRSGEYWRLLLPGKYTMKAVQTNNFGVLESDLMCVEVRFYITH